MDNEARAKACRAAAASFGVREAAYHAHITACPICSSRHEPLLCADGQRLYNEMMEEI